MINTQIIRENWKNLEKLYYLNELMSSFIKDKDLIKEKINFLKSEKKELKIKKYNKIEELYDHYVNIVIDGKDTRLEGIHWGIVEIYKIKKTFNEKYLPKIIIKTIFY